MSRRPVILVFLTIIAAAAGFYAESGPDTLFSASLVWLVLRAWASGGFDGWIAKTWGVCRRAAWKLSPLTATLILCGGFAAWHSAAGWQGMQRFWQSLTLAGRVFVPAAALIGAIALSHIAVFVLTASFIRIRAALFRRLWPTPALPFSTLLREAFLWGSFAIAWSGIAGPNPAIWGAEVAACGVVAALWEGAGTQTPSAGPRLMLAYFALAGHWAVLGGAAARAVDTFVIRSAFGLPGPLIAWLAALALFALALLLAWRLTRNRTWRKDWTNRRALAWLEQREADDTWWQRYFASEHATHRWQKRPLLHVIAEGLHALWSFVLGWPRFRLQLRPKPGRVELFLRDRWMEAARDVEARASRWRALRLRASPQPPQETKDSGQGLEAALERQGRALWLLCDFLLCPSPGCPADPVATPAEQRELALAVDRHLRLVSSLRAFGCASCDKCFHSELLERLQRLYTSLGRNDAGWNAVRDFRMALLAPTPPELKRIELTAQVMAWLATGRKEQSFVFETLLDSLADARDWPGLIEAAREWSLLGRALSPANRMSLGEAYFQYAFQIQEEANSALSSWALDQAASHFYAAGARDSLDVLNARLKKLGGTAGAGGSRKPGRAAD